MKKVSSLMMLALFALSLTASQAEAGRYHRSSFRSSGARYTSSRSMNRYPRARHTDGRTHWDLGKQNGQWPTF